MTNESEENDIFSSDLIILKQMRKAEAKIGFSQIKEIIVCYEPVKPFSISLSTDNILNELGNSVLIGCNTAYADAFKTTKKALIRKETFKKKWIGDADNKKKILTYFIFNNFVAYNIESHQYDSFGEDKWFLNDVFAEIESSKITKIWIRKQDITEQKKLKSMLDLRAEMIKQQESIAHSGSWEYNFYEKKLYISDGFWDLFEVDPKVDLNLLITPYTLFSEKILPRNKSLVKEKHLSIIETLIDFSIEYEICDSQGDTKKIKEICKIIVDSENNPVSIVGMIQDISEKNKIEKRIKKIEMSLSSLINADLAISRALSREELFQSCCESITLENEIFCVSCGLKILDENFFEIIAFSTDGKRQHYEKMINRHHFLGGDVILKSMASRKIEVQKIEFKKNEENDYFFRLVKEKELRSVLVIPMACHEKNDFFLLIYSIHSDAFEKWEINMFQQLSHNLILGMAYQKALESYQISILEKEEQNLKLREAFEDSITTLGSMLEHRDLYTSSHQKRVANLCISLADEYGLNPEKKHWLYLAASVHDIGKIAIPSEILSKPSKLTLTEFALIKTHPEIGFQILKGVDFPAPIAEIVRQHHEYLDGSGYPFGLKSNEILLEAKILAVADITESMLSHRPYRPAFDKIYVMKELKKMRGSKLEPKIVDICIELFEHNKYDFPDFSHPNLKLMTQTNLNHARE